MKKDNIGTWLDGIGVIEDLDSSGERIKISGIDIQSFTQDGVYNYEHKSEEPNQTVGKVLEAKKILKKEDCDNERHEYFWEKAGRKPYLYVAGVLFDKFNHPGAISVAAMLNFDILTDKSKTKNVVNFSIEGSRLDKKGVWINKCIARKMTITHQACNKRCVAEILQNPDNTREVSKESLFEIFKKYEKVESDLQKGFKPSSKLFGEANKPAAPKSLKTPKQPGVKYNSKLSFKTSKKPSAKESFKPVTSATGYHKEGTDIKPKRTMTTTEASGSKDFKAGDRIKHSTKKPRTGKDIYNDPDTWKSENKKKKKLDKFYASNVQKALIAGCGMGAPTTRNGSDALSKEQISKVFKSLSNESFDRFDKKEELLSFLSQRLPNLKSNEINALAKAVAYVAEKKKEAKLKEMVKAKVDNLIPKGKDRKKARAERKTKIQNVKAADYEERRQKTRSKIEDYLYDKDTKESKDKKQKTKQPSKKDLEYPTKDDKLAASEKDVVK